MEEKRGHVRISKKIKSEVHSTEGMTFSTSSDISSGGIFISTPEPVKVGSEVELLLHTSDNKEFALKGIVKWMQDNEVKGNRIGMGIEFVNITDEEAARIKNITK